MKGAALWVLAALGCSGARATAEGVGPPSPRGASPTASATSVASSAPTAIRRLWDMTGVIGSGQSLSIGAQATVVQATTQPFENLKLSLGETTLPPFDPGSPALSLVPLVEPIRPFPSTYPSAYPANIYGETPHTAMGNQVSAMVRAAAGAPYVTVHSVVGENGQGMRVIEKGATPSAEGATSKGRAYRAALFEVSAIKRLADAAGKSYGVGAILLTHGETDAGNPGYEADLVRYWADHDADIRAITGQHEPIVLLLTQQHSFGFTSGAASGASASTLAQWRVGVNHPRDIICVGPKYQYPYAADTVHLEARGYELLGEKYGEVFYERVVLGRDWAPLQPVGVSVSGRVISARFHVPVPPLSWDEALPAPHQAALTEWRAGRGFELRHGSTPLPIESVAIDGDTVRITSGTDLPPDAVLGYAVTSDGSVAPNRARRGGQLCDSDPMVGATTGQAQPNYAVAFELPLP